MNAGKAKEKILEKASSFFQEEEKAYKSPKDSEKQEATRKEKEKKDDEEERSQNRRQGLEDISIRTTDDKFKEVVYKLYNKEINHTQAFLKFQSIHQEAKSKEQREKELTTIRDNFSKRYGKYDSNGREDSRRSGKSNSNSLTNTFLSMKSSIKTHPQAKLAAMDGEVGIAHSYTGEKSEFGPLTPEAVIADKDTCRFVGHEFLTSISTATPAPTQGNYMFPFLLNPRAWVNTRAQLESLNWLTFRINDIKFRYLPVCPTTTQGALVQYINTDVDNNNTLSGGDLNVRVASDYDHVTQTNVWSASEVGARGFQPQLLYCDMNGENRFTYAGQYLMMASGQLPTSTSLGNMFIEYDITFHNKVLNPFNQTLVAAGSATYQKLLNTGDTTFTFAAAELIGGSAPPTNAKCQIVVYSATNMNLISFIDNDSGTSTFNIANGSNLFCYANYPAAPGQVYFFRKPASNPNQDAIITRTISGGATTVTFAFSWWVYQDVL